MIKSETLIPCKPVEKLLPDGVTWTTEMDTNCDGKEWYLFGSAAAYFVILLACINWRNHSQAIINRS